MLATLASKTGISRLELEVRIVAPSSNSALTNGTRRRESGLKFLQMESFTGMYTVSRLIIPSLMASLSVMPAARSESLSAPSMRSILSCPFLMKSMRVSKLPVYLPCMVL